MCVNGHGYTNVFGASYQYEVECGWLTEVKVEVKGEVERKGKGGTKL